MSNKGRERGLPPSPAPENSVPRRATIRRPRRKELACHLTGSGAGIHRHIKRAVLRKLTAVVFQTTGKPGRAPLKIRTCPSASTGRKISGKEGRVRQWDWDDSECVGLGEGRMWFRS